MARDFIEEVIAAQTWPELLEALLSHDMWRARPLSKIREHPCCVALIELLKKDRCAVATLIGYLENFDVLGQWSLVLLPDLTGENPIPESIRGRDELGLELTYWTRWAKQKGIEPIL